MKTNPFIFASRVGCFVQYLVLFLVSIAVLTFVFYGLWFGYCWLFRFVLFLPFSLKLLLWRRSFLRRLQWFCFGNTNGISLGFFWLEWVSSEHLRLLYFISALGVCLISRSGTVFVRVREAIGIKPLEK